ncbi:hypothetical protein TU75_05425 [Pseudomonas poae]|nr:hypothetical protein TU75_05425 [Pseudomonas poae]
MTLVVWNNFGKKLGKMVTLLIIGFFNHLQIGTPVILTHLFHMWRRIQDEPRMDAKALMRGEKLRKFRMRL